MVDTSLLHHSIQTNGEFRILIARNLGQGQKHRRMGEGRLSSQFSHNQNACGKLFMLARLLLRLNICCRRKKRQRPFPLNLTSSTFWKTDQSCGFSLDNDSTVYKIFQMPDVKVDACRLMRQNSFNVAIKCVLNNMVSYNGRSAPRNIPKLPGHFFILRLRIFSVAQASH